MSSSRLRGPSSVRAGPPPPDVRLLERTHRGGSSTDGDVEARCGNPVHPLRHDVRRPPASPPPKPAYAPASPTTRQRRPEMMPSAVSPSSAYCTCPRPCMESCASTWSPPPHRPAEPPRRRVRQPCAGRGRRLPAERPADVRRDHPDATESMPSVFPNLVRQMGHPRRHRDDQVVVGISTSTTTTFGSIGATASRWFSIRARTTTSAPSSTGALQASRAPATRLVPSSSNCSGAPSSSAVSGSTATSSGSSRCRPA